MSENALLAAQIRTCSRCPLAATRTVGVPAEVGEPGRLGILAEAPGKQEDKTGRPFQGQAGEVLNKVLKETGFERGEVTLLNRVRCRPPSNNLDQVPEAVTACHPWLVAELAEYDPKVVVLMGRTALRSIFGATATVGAFRGTVRKTGPTHELGERIWVATYHPAATFYAQDKKAILDFIREDVATARRLLEHVETSC